MKKIFTAFAIVLAMSATSCKSYMDINTDPNRLSPEQVGTDLILPPVEMTIAAVYGDFLRITGGYFCQHYAQMFGTSNYLDFSKFTMSTTRSSSVCYTQLYLRVVGNVNEILSKAKAENDNGTILAATVLRCFALQTLVDIYGSVPYSEAVTESLAPKFDKGEDVYAGLIKELDEAIASAKTGSSHVAKSFLFPGGTVNDWIKFANALKLRILMRECKVADVQSQLASLIQENNFPTSDVEFKGCWAAEAGKESPFYAEEFSTLGGSTQRNVVANVAIISTMQQSDYSDGRLAAFFVPNSQGQFTGGVSGSNFSKSSAYKAAYWCDPVASSDMPVSLISVAEVEFFKAEYYARFANGNGAEESYKKAIEASFASAGADGAASCLAKFPYSKAEFEKCIGVQKWIALAGVNPFEAYCEVRRLRQPAMSDVIGEEIYDDKNDDSYDPSVYVPGTLYTPIKVYDKVGKGKMIERWPFPEATTSRNSNCPEFEGYTVPIFWAK